MILDHCLAPDTQAGHMGCDNMTLLVVGITHGRTKEAWYKWIKERVENGYGYETPDTPRQLYTQRRLESFRERREADEARKKMTAAANNQTPAPTIPKEEPVAVERRSLVGWVVAYLTKLFSGIVAKWKR